MHSAAAWANVQTTSQLPQWSGSVGKRVLSYSQPLATSLSQLLKPGLHTVIVQVLATHEPVAWGGVQSQHFWPVSACSHPFA
jgi:hypothetical protein